MVANRLLVKRNQRGLFIELKGIVEEIERGRGAGRSSIREAVGLCGKREAVENKQGDKENVEKTGRECER